MRGPAIAPVTSRLFSTQAIAKCAAVVPLRLGMLADRLGDLQRLGAQLGLQHALVLAGGAAAGWRRRVRAVLGGQHAAGERAVGHDAEAVMRRGRDLLDLGLAVHGVVVGLADHRPVDAASSQSRQISAMRQQR